MKYFGAVLEQRLSRRDLLVAGGSALAAAGALPAIGATARSGTAGAVYAAIAPTREDALRLSPGLRAQVLIGFGDPLFAGDAGLTARDLRSLKWLDADAAARQGRRFSTNNDALAFFPSRSRRDTGLLCVNHEYVEAELVFAGVSADEKVRVRDRDAWLRANPEAVSWMRAAHGVSVLEVRKGLRGWQVVKGAKATRRITADTPMDIAGPARGAPLMRTVADPTGTRVLGTFANCAAGLTPWGTFLSGEENFQGYFTTADQPTQHEQRWGLGKHSWYDWAAHDPRFDTVRHPNEPHRFGWVVEVDPYDPTSTPVKRTALGRAVHEGAWVAVTKDGRAVVYSGEDAAFEYIYKFVSRDRIKPAGGGRSAAQANRELLDHGTLYVARFDADGRGRWLPLRQGEGPLTPAHGFADQGEVLIKARQASDRLGGTPMDRPEWLAIDERSRWVYCTLTNNSARGPGGKADVDAANPRANNTMGHIIRWREDGDFDGTGFEWNHLVLAGDPANERPEARGNTVGDAFGSPDTIAFDPRGVLWVGSDISTSVLNKADNQRLGNNQLLACDVATRQTRRFLVGPVHAEITSCCFTPDGRTMFVNIQHPGEAPRGRNDPAAPRRWSNWPDFKPNGRPRSATVVVRKLDGGVIGT